MTACRIEIVFNDFAKRMKTGWIAKFLRQIRQHHLFNTRIDRSGSRVIKIDLAIHNVRRVTKKRKTFKVTRLPSKQNKNNTIYESREEPYGFIDRIVFVLFRRLLRV